VDLPTPTKQLNLIDNLDMTRIPKGIHTLNFQFKDDANIWSVISTDTIEKISLPIADYTYEVLSSNCDSTVIAFTDNSIDGDVYLWDFADGTTDTLANPTHTFYNSGVHSVILTITDTTTLADSTKQMDILITGHTANLFAVTSCDSYTSPSGNYTYTTSGVYYDTITNHWGCDSLLIIDLNITYSFFYEENINICQGETYTWHGQILNTAGVYYDSLSTVNGCDSIYKLSLNVNSLPNINLGNDTIVCGDSITLNAGSGFASYNWNTDETTQSINITNSGLYSVTVTNPQNCSNSDEINVTISNISINLEQVGTDLIATINPIVPGEYAWYTCDNQLVLNITTATYQNAPIDGCFYVIFTDNVNCEWTSNEVNVVSIQDNEINIARVYPNPANDVVYIELINDKAVSIYIYDMLGKLKLNEKHDDSLIKIDVSQLNGTYILKVVNENKQSIFRLTIID
jgi:PKD repeat protein